MTKAVSMAFSDDVPTDLAGPRVLGVDVGGTSTRAIIATAEGRILGRGTAPGANRYSSADRFGDVLSAAVREALAGARRPRCDAAVVAVTGLSHPASLQRDVDRVLAAAHIEAPAQVVADVVANHAAGANAADGLVLVAGTGAIAARIGRDRIERRADGLGWLLGDEGSAVWFGIEAIRAVLRAWDGRGGATALSAIVTRSLLGADAVVGPDSTSRMIAVVNARSPASLGQLAPDVIAAAGEDEVAAAIVERAIDHLCRAAITVAGGEQPGSLVIAGSLLLDAPRVTTGVIAALRAEWPKLVIHQGRDGAAGAATIALRSLPGHVVADAVHDRLTQR